MILFGVLIIAVGFQFFRLYEQYADLRDSTGKLRQSMADFTEENERLQADLEYFSNPSNLEKELRARFNYKLPGESVMIVIPPQSHNSSQ